MPAPTTSVPDAHPDQGSANPVGRPAWAEHLTALRTARGITASHAARQMGVSLSTWAGLESGLRSRGGTRVPTVPKEETLHRVADALDLSPTERRHLVMLAQPPQPALSQPWQTRLRAMRVAASVTQREAASTAGVTLATYRHWERKDEGGARHESLRTLLRRLGMSDEQADVFLADVPNSALARPPRQPTNPVTDVPAWSRMLTRARVDQGLYLADVDRLLGQQSVVRRYELGGWPRPDGRLSVPSSHKLTEIAVALAMTPDEIAHLHLLADNQRVLVASTGPKPFLSELLTEIRRATGLTATEVAERVGPLDPSWALVENGDETAVARLGRAQIDQICEALPVRPLLATALRGSVPSAPGSAENK